MNQIFRVIWNHATQSWVAVSELASAKGKTKSKTNKVMLASLVVGSSVIASNSFAAQISTTINNGIGFNGTNIYVKPNGGTVTAETSGTSTIGETISIGTSSLVRDGEILIGNNIRNTATGNSADVVIGHRAILGGGLQDSMSTGVGYGIQVAGPSIALGVGARADIADASGWNAVKNGGTAIGVYSMIGGNKNGSVALGAIAAADADGAVALGTLSGSATQWLDYANRGLGFNTNDTTGTYTTSVGYKSGARGFDSVAVGVNASTGLNNSAKGAVAVGNSTRAYGEGSLALGNRSVAGGYTDAMITQLNTKKTQVEAELTKAKERLAYWNEQVAQDASAYNKFNVGNLNAIVARLELTLERTKDDLTRALTAKGIPSSITSNFALAVGTQAEALSESSTAIGTLAKSYTQNGLAIGRSSNITNVNSTNSIAIGTDARVTGDTSTSSLAIGHGSNVSGKEAIAIGRSTAVSGSNSVALGSYITKLTTANSVVLGASSTEVVGITGASHAVQAVNDATVRTIAGPNFTYSGFVGKPADAGHYVSIGQAGKERQIKNLAAGAVTPTSTDAINGSQLYALMDRVENKQEPVVYTNKDGDKLVKVGDDFYKTGDLDPATGKPLAGKNPVPASDVIASMNNAGNNTTTPMALANIANNLPKIDNANATVTMPDGETLQNVPEYLAKAPITAEEAAAIANGSSGNNAATVSDVLNAGWNLQNNGEAKDFVKPYDTVNFVDGKGTKAVVESDNETSNVTFNVDTVDMTSNPNGTVENPMGDNAKQLLDDLAAAKKAVADNPDDEAAKAKLKDAEDAVNKAGGNKIATAQNVANMINNSGFTLKADKVEGGENTTDGDNANNEKLTEKGELIKPGSTVTMKAGKNMTVKHEKGGNITYATKDDVEFNSVTVGPKFVDDQGNPVTKVGDKYLDKDGKEVPADKVKPFAPVAMKTEKATPADNNQDGKAPTTALNVTSTDGKPTQITGVGSVLNTNPVATSPAGSVTPEANQPKLVNLGTKPNDKGEVTPLDENVLNSAATVRDLANMGWIVSSDKTTGALSTPYTDTVKNANEVKFIGTGAATVSGKTVGGIRTITVDVKQPEIATLKSENGKVIEPADALADAKKKLAENPNDEAAKKAVEDAQNAVNNAGNQLATAANVAEMINKSGFNLKTSADENSNGEKAKGTKDDGELINPGATVEMIAGKNMSVKQDADGKVTYATKDDVEFNTVTVGPKFVDEQGNPVTKMGDKYLDKDGKEVPADKVKPFAPVAMKTEKATPADNNQDGKAPTTALNVTSTDGKPTQITGVGSVLSNESIPTNTNGAPNNQPNLVNLGTKPDENGKVKPLPENVLNSAATVRDLANMGWVVGAPENGYVDTVKNANKVDFKGENGISVTGKTNDKGVREITISVAEGKVTNDVKVTKADGTLIKGVKGPDGKLYEKGQDGKPDTSKEITLAEGDKVNNEGSKFVSGNAVATAIQESGWNIGKAEAKDVTKAFEKEAKVHDKVNPNDDVKFIDGQNTVVKMVTVDAKNEDGSKKATTFVKVDVTGLPVQYTDKNGTPVTKVGDKYFTVDDKGNPTTTEVAPADLVTNMVNPAAAPNKIGDAMTLGNVKSNLPETKNGNNPTLNQAAPTDKDADKVKNNAATVSDVLNAGWNLQNNGEARDFVKPYDTVNFVDGKGTKAVVETTNGTTSNVKFDIDTGSITNNADGSVQGPVTSEMTKALEDAKNALNSLPANAPASVRKAAEQAVLDAKNNIENVKNKVATAEDVANAINKSGFTLTTSANGGKKISGTPEVINPGKKVEMVAGKNMTVKQESNGKVTYATASNVTFDSVQFGNNGPKITNNDGNINVGTATGAPTKITGVAPGEISATSKDAVNGSQLYSVAKGVGNRINNLQGQINKLGNRMNAGMATSAAMANLLQPHKPGQSVATAGIGQHKNQSAVAVGYSRISDNGKYGVRFSMGANTQGEVTGGAAVGYFW